MSLHVQTVWKTDDQFNVELCSKEGAEAFLSIRGCRIVSGSKGEFVSFPATKNQSTNKYWNHVWANEKFAAAVLAKAKESRQSSRGSRSRDEDEPPF